MKKIKSGLVAGAAAGIMTIMSSGAAFADDPLMGKAPWSFTPQNRAAIAIAIKNAEDGNSGGSGAGTIVCGGNSGASGAGATGASAGATANSSCIIINNSDGAIVNNDQTSEGDQDADASANSTTNNVTNNAPKKSGGSIDEVGAILYGNKQGL